jgi:NADPH:quinone reductase-like Zn-dependent oxidoreductase
MSERPEPVERRGWVLVELQAAGVNWHDCLVRRGVYDFRPPLIIGADGAGRRRDTGEVVLILPSLWWGDSERAPAASFTILGDGVDGTYAELVAVPAENLVPRPSGWSDTEAAALALGATTAYRALFTRAGLDTGETVVVLGAGSGVSTIAVSPAAIVGARVFVTSSSMSKIERSRGLGASGGVLYTDTSWTAQLRELAGPRGIDVVIDGGGSTWPESLSVLNPGGRIVSFGATAGDQAVVSVRPFYFGQHSILGTTLGSPRDFEAMLKLLASAPSWRPPIDSVYELERAADAHVQMERRDNFGKLVLSIG